jgi:hypothetical protein
MFVRTQRMPAHSLGERGVRCLRPRCLFARERFHYGLSEADERGRLQEGFGRGCAAWGAGVLCR